MQQKEIVIIGDSSQFEPNQARLMVAMGRVETDPDVVTDEQRLAHWTEMRQGALAEMWSYMTDVAKATEQSISRKIRYKDPEGHKRTELLHYNPVRHSDVKARPTDGDLKDWYKEFRPFPNDLTGQILIYQRSVDNLVGGGLWAARHKHVRTLRGQLAKLQSPTEVMAVMVPYDSVEDVIDQFDGMDRNLRLAHSDATLQHPLIYAGLDPGTGNYINLVPGKSLNGTESLEGYAFSGANAKKVRGAIEAERARICKEGVPVSGSVAAG